MNSLPLIVSSGNQLSRRIKNLAYGDGSLRMQSREIRDGRLHRLERGFPYLRANNAGTPVSATPLFRALTLYTINKKTSQLPTSGVTPGSIAYPTLAKL